MKTKIILTLLTISILTSCKKDYVCECPNGISSTSETKIHDTKEKAEKECAEKFSPGGGSCKLK